MCYFNLNPLELSRAPSATSNGLRRSHIAPGTYSSLDCLDPE
jgi:hypothetical protein